MGGTGLHTDGARSKKIGRWVAIMRQRQVSNVKQKIRSCKISKGDNLSWPEV